MKHDKCDVTTKKKKKFSACQKTQSTTNKQYVLQNYLQEVRQGHVGRLRRPQGTVTHYNCSGFFFFFIWIKYKSRYCYITTPFHPQKEIRKRRCCDWDVQFSILTFFTRFMFWSLYFVPPQLAPPMSMPQWSHPCSVLAVIFLPSMFSLVPQPQCLFCSPPS